MKYITRLVLIIIFANLSLSFVASQPIIAWEAWLYDEDRGLIIEVDSNGLIIQQQFLPADPSDVFPRSVAVSRSGNIVAYNLYAGSGQRLLIYDTVARSVPVNVLVAGTASDSVFTSLEFETSSHIFSTDETRVAFGYQINNTWSVLVYDIVTGALVGSINQSAPAFSSLAGTPALVPTIRAFDGNNVDITLIYSQAGGAAEYPAYRWTISTGSISPNPAFRSMSSDFFAPTNETIMALFDDRLPNRMAELMGPGPQFNVLTRGLSNTGDTAPVLSERDFELGSPYYIQNAALVAFYERPIDPGLPRWSVIDRRGGRVGTLQMQDILPDALLGVGDGFVYSARTSELGFVPGASAVPNTTALVYVRTVEGIAGNPGRVVYFGESGFFPRLVGIQDNVGLALPLPGEWATLMDGAPLTAGGSISIGGTATIFTTEGDRVNVRSLPSLGGSIVDRLEASTRVSIIDGPRNADGFTWWRVRTPRNIEGWVAEFADGIQILQPDAGGSAPVVTAAAPGPAFGGALRVGQDAIVTSAGNRLNVRRDPNTSAGVVAVLDSGTVVRVNEGPIEAGGFLWWRISSPSGSGWAAEGSGDTAFMQPYTPLPTATPSPTLPPAFTLTPTPLTPVLGEPAVMLSAPLQVSPANGASFGNFPRTTTLVWQPVTGAAQYRVQVQYCSDAGATNCTNLTERLTSDNFITFDFVGAQPGRWRVQAVSSSGNAGLWSPWWVFTYTT